MLRSDIHNTRVYYVPVAAALLVVSAVPCRKLKMSDSEIVPMARRCARERMPQGKAGVREVCEMEIQLTERAPSTCMPHKAKRRDDKTHRVRINDHGAHLACLHETRKDRVQRVRGAANRHGADFLRRQRPRPIRSERACSQKNEEGRKKEKRKKTTEETPSFERTVCALSACRMSMSSDKVFFSITSDCAASKR